MTNHLILEMKIKQQKLKKDVQELQIKMARLVNELSTYIATFYDDCETIDAEKIEQIGDELLATKEKLFEAKKVLAQITKDLGE